ncbi:hypothetical protein Pnap_0108 [Polaromonas naphthalenivorans CJ2]|uniref:Uncharacterized protein n=2 Tax=Polaromonas naphthalenivorans TaxID=216465 RepID=A1VIF5_POLNA|nr:hypothetical protein Pnap_0108 [Polaromonas naphthalenivorans CJ2]
MRSGAAAGRLKKVNSGQVFQAFQELLMNPSAQHTTNAAHDSPTPAQEQDAVDAIVPIIPIVLPLVGGVLMFLLAFIAIYMA